MTSQIDAAPKRYRNGTRADALVQLFVGCLLERDSDIAVWRFRPSCNSEPLVKVVRDKLLGHLPCFFKLICFFRRDKLAAHIAAVQIVCKNVVAFV